jgi:hypothetical protein
MRRGRNVVRARALPLPAPLPARLHGGGGLRGGVPSDRTLAQRLVRRAESEAEVETGRMVKIQVGAAMARLAWPLIDRLAERMGARFDCVLQPDWPRDRFEVTLP